MAYYDWLLKMTYLISQDWSNTGDNHAGIKYLCNKIQEMYPDDYKSIVIPAYWDNNKVSGNRFVRHAQLLVAKAKHRRCSDRILRNIISEAKEGDKVFVMEYLEQMYPMLRFARKFKKAKPRNPLLAMVHLVPGKLEKAFKPTELNRWTSSVDKILTLGHSLTDYLVSKGVDGNKVATVFHYVDEYYYNPNPVRNHDTIKVIAMGNQMRNVGLLKQIVTHNPNVDFTVCQGVNDLSSYFAGCQNVNLIPFVAEEELRQRMQEADISINVMDDTVGSNVIVTSLAMGLAMICSDVGSIRDYCDESNTVFCKTAEDFSNAITSVINDPRRLSTMQLSSSQKARDFSITHFVNLLKNV